MSVAIIALRLIESVSASPIAPLAKDMMRFCEQIKSASKIAYQAHATVAAFKDAKAPPTPIMRLCQRIWAFAQVAYSVLELVGALKAAQPAATSNWAQASNLRRQIDTSQTLYPPATLPARALAATMYRDDASSTSGDSSDDDDWSDAQADFNANLPKIRSWASVGRNLASWGRTLTIM
eukprot:gene4650-14845_t